MHQELLALIDTRLDILNHLLRESIPEEEQVLLARVLELHGLRQELCLLIA